MEYFLHPGHYGSHVLYYGSSNPAKQLIHRHISTGEWMLMGSGVLFLFVVFIVYFWTLTGRLPFTKNPK